MSELSRRLLLGSLAVLCFDVRLTADEPNVCSRSPVAIGIGICWFSRLKASMLPKPATS